jgi:hypothetical protein
MKFSEKKINKCYHNNIKGYYLCTTKAATHYSLTYLNKKIMTILVVKATIQEAQKMINAINDGGFENMVKSNFETSAGKLTVSSECFDLIQLIRICCGVKNS